MCFANTGLLVQIQLLPNIIYMKFQKKKNINQRLLFKNYEKKRLILKSLTYNVLLNKNIRWRIQLNFLKIPLNSSLTRIKNRCILTNRARSIYRFFKLSRIQFKNLILKNKLPGFFKYSW